MGQHRVCSPRVEGHHVALLDVAQRLAGSLSLQLAVDDLPAGEVGKQIPIFRQTGSAPDIFDPSLLLHIFQVAADSVHRNLQKLAQLCYLHCGLQLKLLQYQLSPFVIQHHGTGLLFAVFF